MLFGYFLVPVDKFAILVKPIYCYLCC